MSVTAAAAGMALASAPVFAHAHGLLDAVPTGSVPVPVTALLLIAAWVGYLVGGRRVAPRPGRAALFHLAATLTLLTLLGPFDTWAGRGAAMHMVQHMLLMVVIAPLWVLARPLAQWRAALGRRLRRHWLRVLNTARLPLTMTALHGATIWFWHAPRMYLLALDNPWWHALEHACFLLSAGLFWWAVLRAAPPRRARALLALLITLMHTGLLGALLTFANVPLYGDAADIGEQQLAGLLMWLPGGVVYLVAAAACGQAWLGQSWRRSSSM